MQIETQGQLTRIEICISQASPDRTGQQGQSLAEGGDIPRVRPGLPVAVDHLFQAREVAEKGQELFQATGGTHCATLFGSGPRVLARAEDVGRHNALDKVVGQTLGHELESSQLMVLSSRLNSEMVGKAVQAGIPLLAGVSAPTQRGVSLADQAGMTLIGFLRPGRFNVYTHAWRIVE
jgi:FdhD protein